MTSKRAKEEKLGKMGPCMRVCIGRAKSTVKADIPGRMVPYTKANGATTRYGVRGGTPGLMEDNIMANGN